MKIKRLVLFVLLSPIIICVGFFVLLLVPLLVGDIRARTRIHLPDGTERIYEERRDWVSNTGVRSIYYWINEPVSDIKDYYSNNGVTFIAEGDTNSEERWFIGLLTDDEGVDYQYIQVYRHGIHQYLCDYREYYSCLTVAVMDASQNNLHNLSVNLPTTNRREIEPPAFATLPNWGTLITITYFDHDY